MKVLITGAGGQLGRELQASRPGSVAVVALEREHCDISDQRAVEQIVTHEAPELIINAAAYTAVDKAEQEPASAHAINHFGVENLALTAAKINAKIIHVSTDFVFDGEQSRPYQADAATNPQSVYGASKLAGEQALIENLPDNHILIRTSWVYSQYGQNFVKTMLRLMRERERLGVVADQTGSPTWANGLAQAIWAFADRSEIVGQYHWSDAGTASWYDFAVAIHGEGLDSGLLTKPVTIQPITTEDYPTPAARPAFSVLDCSHTRAVLGLEASHWQSNLAAMIKRLVAS